MIKAFIPLEYIPKNCKECPFARGENRLTKTSFCGINKEIRCDKKGLPELCPILLMPERQDTVKEGSAMYRIGYNECLDAIERRHSEYIIKFGKKVYKEK